MQNLAPEYAAVLESPELLFPGASRQLQIHSRLRTSKILRYAQLFWFSLQTAKVALGMECVLAAKTFADAKADGRQQESGRQCNSFPNVLSAFPIGFSITGNALGLEAEGG